MVNARWKAPTVLFARAFAAVVALTSMLAAQATRDTEDGVPLDSVQLDSASDLTLAELTAQLERLQQELAETTTEVAAAQETWEAEIASREAERQALAGEVFSEGLQEARLSDEKTALDKELTTTQSVASAQVESLQRMLTEALAFFEALHIYLRELPAADDSKLAVDEILPSLRVREIAVCEPIASLLPALDRLHEEGSKIAVYPRDIRSAAGERESVRLLGIGHFAFAYASGSRGEIGVALNSPVDVAGYRWAENVDARTQESVETAIGDLTVGGNATLRIPLDPSGRLTVDSALRQQNFVEVLQSGGPVMIPLALVALIAVVLILERSWLLHRERRLSRSLMAKLLAACREGRYADATKLCQRRGVVGRTLTACLEARQRGTQAMEDGIQEQLLHELPRLQRFLGGIAVLGGVAPLLGLLGTVTGIIQTFGVIKVYRNTDPGLMAGGISEALVTTATGLVIAIVILLIHSLLSGRVEKLLGEAEKNAASLLNALAGREEK